ncbi:MAG TPA: LytTR family DNA-binding domain-containing protein [Ideonella sp.]|uniref:LytR/AlgR family response regulator transcription factor n=1 Tax=Ideonella sp. TaxID=1929293 RepID=UPI002E365325|nr:LytTR family DNA-binding domain-containing protein [Ideonella sp.]HEX5682936.1 LytTR family DNA-binding domain-containing protein [Ideonella sp.]
MTPNDSPDRVAVLVADDEEAPRQQLIAALRQAWPAARIVAEATNGVDAWDAFLEHEPQVCFLDIRMPGLSGIEVAQRIDGRVPVVFVTAFGDHALAAFDAGAVDYVMKPVDAARLGQALQRVQTRLDRPAAPDLSALLAQLSGQLRKPAPPAVIQASVGKEVKLIRIEQIVYFESDARYTRVAYDDEAGPGEALIRTPLKELLAQLDADQFWQVHRSVIVNHRHIASALRIDEGTMVLTLRGRSERLPVSRHFQGLFKGQ